VVAGERRPRGARPGFPDLVAFWLRDHGGGSKQGLVRRWGAARTPGSIVPRAWSPSTYRRPRDACLGGLPVAASWDAPRRPVLVPAVVSKRDPSRWRLGWTHRHRPESVGGTLFGRTRCRAAPKRAACPGGGGRGPRSETQAARPILMRAVSARVFDQSPWGPRRMARACHTASAGCSKSTASWSSRSSSPLAARLRRLAAAPGRYQANRARRRICSAPGFVRAVQAFLHIKR
jgi:hypothetical protein